MKLLLLTLCFFFSFQFYLQDTKSSNGTFINSQRLSRGSEESPPCEILSGDIIQFGVDVTENTRKGMSMDQFLLLFLLINFKIFISDIKDYRLVKSKYDICSKNFKLPSSICFSKVINYKMLTSSEYSSLCYENIGSYCVRKHLAVVILHPS